MSNALAKISVVVLDSFAAISFLRGEAGATRVQEVLTVACREDRRVLLSAISLGEIAYISERRHGLPAVQAVLSAIQSLPVEVVEVDLQVVLAAAHVKAQHPISLADAFVVALALAQDGTILTGDPEFRSVEGVVPIEWLPV
jgi:predicted nucleic acid-binding protein